jgi:RNA polymerase sigma-70 factor (ECF subfamily)
VRLERSLVGQLEQSSVLLACGLAAPDSSPSARAARHENAVRLAEALEQLPSGYREVIVLHHVECLAWIDVACRMGRSVDAVKNLWARALVRLHSFLGSAS